ncbi:hypothetical protein CbuK_1806 [Coxiella burnetii CbuK_Q154]|nr:hypothetical protein CbuG_0435 [Coxiella burnetii CbuG_Q212]ACJ20932.1 hypothetical protein CbuK_1806 [Coxiella burnetii CbuK_Q154]
MTAPTSDGTVKSITYLKNEIVLLQQEGLLSCGELFSSLF